jgi:hypothetical protein
VTEAKSHLRRRSVNQMSAPGMDQIPPVHLSVCIMQILIGQVPFLA